MAISLEELRADARKRLHTAQGLSKQIITRELADEAVTIDDFFAPEALVGFTAGTTETEIGRIIVPTSGGVVSIIGSCRASSATNSLNVRIRKDNITGKVLTEGFSGLNTNPITLITKDPSPSISQVYVLTAESTTSSQSVFSRVLLGTNRKK